MAAYEGFWADLLRRENGVGELLDVQNNPITLADLNPTVLVLMSAYWCPPCRALTPSVVKFIEDNKDEVSVVYFSRDYNETMQNFNLRTKPYNKFSWQPTNISTFKYLKTKYPSIQGIPTLFAVDRDTGNIYTERGAVSIRMYPDTVIEQWKNGEDITQEQEDEYWSRSRKSDAEPVDIVEHLPLNTIVTLSGDPIHYDDLNRYVFFYFNAAWSHSAEDEITPAIAAFAKEHPDDVSVVYFSLDVDVAKAEKTLQDTGFHYFQLTQNLIQTAYELDKIMSKDDVYNTLAAPRLFVIEKDSHRVAARYHYGIFINPSKLIPAWDIGEAGVTDEEINDWFEQRWIRSLRVEDTYNSTTHCHYSTHCMSEIKQYRGFWADLFSPNNILGVLVDANDNPISISELNPVVIVLLAAYWCPPCRSLTPTVLKFLQDNKDEVSVVYFGRDYNEVMQQIYLRNKPYNKFTWQPTNVATFQHLKSKYPSIRGIPTAFAVDRDTGKIYSERARIGLLLFPDLMLNEWKNGNDITVEQENEYWMHDDKEETNDVDIVPHLPLDTIFSPLGDPIEYDRLNKYVLLYVNAVWAHAETDALTADIVAFAKEYPEDVSVVYFSLDVDKADAEKTLQNTGFNYFEINENLIEIAYQLDKLMTKEDQSNTLAAPRVLVVEKDSHIIVAQHHFGIVIKPSYMIAAWENNQPGITDEEINDWFEKKFNEAQLKASNENDIHSSDEDE
ncbi:hypothetical protein THRCLA_03161 [Thraustotheca clavata]|uniref:Thioredoxin domain-containing protein n=1 Tax=Thraustotheca clavata TaxID=74557 RepID=A0A1W0A2W3_9STRA|nr:hypothetical protein THRCLA_03161 [Thraustotheca clavata]